MNLEALTLEVRPRSPWEAMDLAVRLAVSHWRILLSSWMISVFPVFLIINIMLLDEHPYWAFFLVWFLKPLYDRVPLFVLSRVIFSEKTVWQDVVSAIPAFFKTGIFSSLTLYRLDPGRAFGLPVRQLEHLKGKVRRQRMDTLGRGCNNREVIFFVLCFHLESLLSWGLIGLLLMMLPVDTAIQSAESIFMNEEPGLLLNAVSMLMYFIVMMIVETLYISGGFVLYLNRRIILEGWDIELVFRKLSQRSVSKKSSSTSFSGHKPSSILTILLSTTLFFFSGGIAQNAQAISQNASSAYEKILPAIATSPVAAEESTKIVQQVMEEPIFKRFKKIETLQYTGETESDEDDLENSRSWLTQVFKTIGQTLAYLFEIGLWVLLLSLIFLIIKYRERLQISVGWLFRSKDSSAEMPEMLFGLDLRDESLPEDVTGQAREFYKKQDYRASLALLYRAALAYLVKNYEFKLAKGATEEDCLELVSKKLSLSSKAEINYFIDLTRAWQLTAYAHRSISEQQMEQLCLNWSRYYKQKQPLESGIQNGKHNE